MGDIWLCAGRKRTGIKPGFILTISSENKLSVWDEEGKPVHFMDFEQGDKRLVELPLDRYTGGGYGDEMLLDLIAAMTSAGENLRIRAGKGESGIRPDFIMSIAYDENLFAIWDDRGNLVHFTDVKRTEKYDALPLSFYTGGGHPGILFLKLLATMAGFDLNYVGFSETKIRCRCEVPDLGLYRVTDPNRLSHIYTLGRGARHPFARPINR